VLRLDLGLGCGQFAGGRIDRQSERLLLELGGPVVKCVSFQGFTCSKYY
jgi:hypothetical protein